MYVFVCAPLHNFPCHSHLCSCNHIDTASPVAATACSCCLPRLQRIAWVLGGVGAVLLLRKAVRHAWLRHRERQARERVRKALAARAGAGDGAPAAAASSSALVSAAVDGDAAERGAGADARDAGTCVVCLSAPSEVVWVRCGHMCCCQRCSAALPGRRCPVCRMEGSTVKVFRT